MGEETEKLIEQVRKFVYWHDTSHKLYKNVVKKAEAWNVNAEELGITSDAAKTKWKSLRDNYMRYKKSVKGVTGQAKNFLQYLQSKPARREFDGIDHLFLSYADTFRKFHPATQALMKMELATLFAKMEMKGLGSGNWVAGESPRAAITSRDSQTPAQSSSKEYRSKQILQSLS
ncbi:uncharacterized protein LOC134528844 [Bacillus rossius redtenbacheri]|uniref:uncharacterized protein LOC134528844 n=1 Tax=Bacillus rossius redtenbacheri TaxID=93214 RepID=UPI002FDE8CFE